MKLEITVKLTPIAVADLKPGKLSSQFGQQFLSVGSSICSPEFELGYIHTN